MAVHQNHLWFVFVFVLIQISWRHPSCILIQYIWDETPEIGMICSHKFGSGSIITSCLFLQFLTKHYTRFSAGNSLLLIFPVPHFPSTIY